MNRSIRFAFAAAAIMTASATASAEDTAARHVDVAYGDLDLTTRAGRVALEGRIDQAAARVCGGNPVFATTYRDAPQFHEKAFERCRTEARYRALADLERRGVRVAKR